MNIFETIKTYSHQICILALALWLAALLAIDLGWSAYQSAKRTFAPADASTLITPSGRNARGCIERNGLEICEDFGGRS